MGTHVRMVGAGVIGEPVLGIVASADVIVAGTSSGRVVVFDMPSGDLILSFGTPGTTAGRLNGCSGVRLTPDGHHVLIAEHWNRRLSLFTLTGEFVRCIGEDALNQPNDVDFATNGDVLVADKGNNRICVYSPDGSALLRSFGSQGDAAGEFKSPFSLAVHGGQLYVLEYDAARVQVFE